MKKLLTLLSSHKGMAVLAFTLGFAGIAGLSALNATPVSAGKLCDKTKVCGYIKNGGSRSITITCQWRDSPKVPSKQRILKAGQTNKTKSGCKDADGFWVPKGYTMERRDCRQGVCWWQPAYKNPGKNKNGWHKIRDIDQYQLRLMKN